MILLVFSRRKQLAKIKRRNLITYSNPESIISEQFRTIRTNIHFLNEAEKNNLLVVSSPGQSEGKSTIIANTAISIAQQKEKVLLIDGNLRNPSIHQLFKVSNEVGLTDVLSEKTPFCEAITKCNIDNLDLLTSGPIPLDPAELLESEKMKELLSHVKPLYDLILVDSPSVLEVTDTKVLANLCDGVILVVQKAKTKLEAAQESKKVLEFAKAPLVGVIVNQVS
ncbi:CpsD/CapB family tyrosine-protein kinase [Robertmurraya korlensis]|uniref:CpsD/CapB family tyrosine-protein kinase n=1 Tax=Robertmurraya korlensis TaxID=519977 RepID=UPI001E532945|nr:CpsD/CapB family tyrosine-protein kinase [Robertmurraya korlensis]